MDYRNRHVVVTGGTGALGTAVVGSLVEAGATCHVPYVVAAEAERFALRDHSNVKLIECRSLSEEADVVRLYGTVSQLWASVHLVGGFAMAPVAETTKVDLMKQVDMNFVTAFLCCRAAVNAMAARGGRIVNVAARPVLAPVANMTAYTAAKAGVAALTQALAAEVLKDNILVNAVLPSIIDTPANRAAMPSADHDAWPKPADLGEVIAFLASPENAVTSGTLVPVYGKA